MAYRNGSRGGSRQSGGRKSFGGRRRSGGGGGKWGGSRRPRSNDRRRDPRQASMSGNARERISIESGDMVLIDQFMLANPQFIEEYGKNIDADAQKKNEIIAEFGGSVVTIEPGTYKIERDPFAFTIIIHPEDDNVAQDRITEEANEGAGRVFIDTRCLAMVDRELLDDSELLQKYHDLWSQGEEKACRDLLRDNGGAVRYGFQRSGDELGIYRIPESDVICLWPDVVENVSSSEASPA